MPRLLNPNAFFKFSFFPGKRLICLVKLGNLAVETIVKHGYLWFRSLRILASNSTGCIKKTEQI